MDNGIVHNGVMGSVADGWRDVCVVLCAARSESGARGEGEWCIPPGIRAKLRSAFRRGTCPASPKYIPQNHFPVYHSTAPRSLRQRLQCCDWLAGSSAINIIVEVCPSFSWFSRSGWLQACPPVLARMGPRDAARLGVCIVDRCLPFAPTACLRFRPFLRLDQHGMNLRFASKGALSAKGCALYFADTFAKSNNCASHTTAVHEGSSPHLTTRSAPCPSRASLGA